MSQCFLYALFDYRFDIFLLKTPIFLCAHEVLTHSRSLFSTFHPQAKLRQMRGVRLGNKATQAKLVDILGGGFPGLGPILDKDAILQCLGNTLNQEFASVHSKEKMLAELCDELKSLDPSCSPSVIPNRPGFDNVDTINGLLQCFRDMEFAWMEEFAAALGLEPYVI